MTGQTKRKWRWSSKSLFASIAPNKAVKLEHSVLRTQDGAADQIPTIDMSLDGCNTRDGQQRPNVAARMRRNGSKLLSAVGIQRGNECLLWAIRIADKQGKDDRASKGSSTALSERDVALAIAKDAAAPSISTTDTTSGLRLLDTQVRTEGTSCSLQTNALNWLFPLPPIEGMHVVVADSPRMLRGPSQPPKSPTDVSVAFIQPGGTHQSKSTTGFAHQLSHKLSSTFGNPTIVHRPNYRTRPALLSMHEEHRLGADTHTDLLPSPQESTAPSSYNASGSVSAGDPSTVRVLWAIDFVSVLRSAACLK